MVGGERFGRYSFIGLAAETRLEIRGYTCTEYRGNRAVSETTAADPLDPDLLFGGTVEKCRLSTNSPPANITPPPGPDRARERPNRGP